MQAQGTAHENLARAIFDELNDNQYWLSCTKGELKFTSERVSSVIEGD